MAVTETSTAGDVGGRLAVRRPDADTLLLALSGRWTLGERTAAPSDVERHLAAASGIRRIGFDTAAMGEWDSALLTFLFTVRRICGRAGIGLDDSGLPSGVRRLLKLAAAVPETEGARRGRAPAPLLTRVGRSVLERWTAGGDAVAFVGEVAQSLGRFATGRARFQAADLWLAIQQCGAQALPIVSLISVLVGLILAFVGSVQLQQFGAQIFVANLVGISMAREMGAMMAAIIMAGRTGAAFAAQLGTMQVNEEVDALQTLGIPPIDFLVLPRMIALVLMMPLLCVYASLVGILGGAVVGVGMLDIPAAAYFHQTQSAVKVADFAVGIAKSGVFGVLIAYSGCLRGIQCGRSASAVGAAATSAVVTAIVLIVVADGLFAVLTNLLGI
jgi:phospholipid/cholesterol/gamma-HCH transport system permease protein